MRRTVLFLIIAICGFINAGKVYAATYPVTVEDALAMAKRQFSGQDVNYFLVDNGNDSSWTIFIDAEPMKRWGHECYTLTCPRSTSSLYMADVRAVKVLDQMPPEGDYTPLDVTATADFEKSREPHVPKHTLSNEVEISSAQRTYAVIINGGINKVQNCIGHWLDCSFIYQTLTKRFGIPKNNIVPIMADGRNPELDTSSPSEGFISQSLDLDYDGEDEIELAATKSNIDSVLNSLKNKMNSGDHLFMFVTDHGGRNKNNGLTYICLWKNDSVKGNNIGETKLYDFELREMLRPFSEKNILVNAVFGQCYSGGSVIELSNIKCVAASSTGNDTGYLNNNSYNEFLRLWTSAVNGADEKGNVVDADYDSNGYVTMDEAFRYTMDYNGISESNIVRYVSTPPTLGEDLAFNHLPPIVNLYIKDNDKDKGNEPNRSTNLSWISPSVWLRNIPDGIHEHQNIDYSSDTSLATVYVRVHNRGIKDYTPGNRYVKAYWSTGTLAPAADSWLGNETDDSGNATGGVIGTAALPAIPSDEYRDVLVSFRIPQSLSDEMMSGNERCVSLLAMLCDSVSGNEADSLDDCLASGRMAHNSTLVIPRTALAKEFEINLRNNHDEWESFSLELRPRTTADQGIFNKADVEMEFCPGLKQAWESAGSPGTDITVVDEGDVVKIKPVSASNRVDGIGLYPGETGIVKVRFSFRSISPDCNDYTLDFIQRNSSQLIEGGQAMRIEAPMGLSGDVVVTPVDTLTGDFTVLGVNAAPGDCVRWENANGETIGRNGTVAVSPAPRADNTYRAYVLSPEGELGTGSITLEPAYGISSVGTVGRMMRICLKQPADVGDAILISSNSTATQILSKALLKGEADVEMDISSLETGSYTVAYARGGIILDSVKVMVW